jgi:hypothetical protein
MGMRHSALQAVVAAGIAVVCLCVFSVALQGQERRNQQGGGSAALAWRLIADFEQERSDVITLAEQALDLSSQQRQKMRGLHRDMEAEKAQLLRKLNKRFEDKVVDTLAKEQKERYQAVLKAMEDMMVATTAARDEFLAAVGATEQSGVSLDLYVSTTDLARFLDVSEEKRGQLGQARKDMDRALAENLQQTVDRANWNDPAALQAYRQRYRDAQKKAQDELQERRKAILSPEQLKKLESIEAAARAYAQRLRDIRRQAYERISAALPTGQ